MNVFVIAAGEIKLGFRNPWSYSFLALFTLFSLSLWLIQGQQPLGGYTHATGTMLNLIVYLLPLMTLLLGSFSVTGEKEDGRWQLLATYPLSATQWLWGKWIGVSVTLACIVAFGFGLSGMVGWFMDSDFTAESLLWLFSFAEVLMLTFLGLALAVGALCKNRWQALTISVGIWFLFVLGWPTLMIGVLGWVPYGWIKPMLEMLTLLNPAESVRIFTIMKIGGGAVFGPEYYQWLQWARGSGSAAAFALYVLAWVAIPVILAGRYLERRKTSA